MVGGQLPTTYVDQMGIFSQSACSPMEDLAVANNQSIIGNAPGPQLSSAYNGTHEHGLMTEEQPEPSQMATHIGAMDLPQCKESESIEQTLVIQGPPNPDQSEIRSMGSFLPILARGTHPETTPSPRKAVMNTVPRRRHRRRTPSPKSSRWRCIECNKSFERSYNYVKHMTTHDPDRPKPYVCVIQGCHQRPFARPHDLQRHIETVRRYIIRKPAKLTRHRYIGKTGHLNAAIAHTKLVAKIL
jgi:hypothetical protein